MLKKLFSYLACALMVTLLFACKKESPVNEGIDLFGGTEWRGKVNLSLALDKKTYYYVCRFYKDGTFRISQADEGGMVFKETDFGTYKYEKGYIHLDGDRANYAFAYDTSPDISIMAHGFGVRMYKQ